MGSDQAVGTAEIAQRENIRILHITDLHIVSASNDTIYGVDPYLSLRHVLDAAFELDETPEIIVATGDLSEDGSAQSYRRLRDLLLTFGVPVFVLPGNHDSLERMSEYLVGRHIRMGFLHEAMGWKLMFLNSQAPNYSYGHITDKTVNELKDALGKDSQTPFLVALHHSPISQCSDPDCQLLNAETFLATLGSHSNVRAVISGHTHVEAVIERGQLMVMTTPATSAQITHVQDKQSSDAETMHRLDPSCHGFRIVDLLSNGRIETRTQWVTNPALA